MSQITIYSKFGVLIASPMECVELEKSISVGTNAQNQVDQGASDDGAQVIEAPSDSSESETSD